MQALKVGDKVEVADEGLEMLRNICPRMPPNHHGTVHAIRGDIVMVAFPIGGHSQLSPYPRAQVKKRSTKPRKDS
jgi:hypothetical protein